MNVSIVKNPSLCLLVCGPTRRLTENRRSISVRSVTSPFLFSSDMKRHILTHSGEKGYVCLQCKTTFACSGTLDRRKLTHSGVKDYKCFSCDRSFAMQSGLNEHKKAHLGIKEYNCEQCDMSFTHAGVLKTHILKLHTHKKILLKRYMANPNSRSACQGSNNEDVKKEEGEVTQEEGELI